MDKSDKTSTRTFYQLFPRRVAEAGKRIGRPLSYAEKILFTHLHEWPAGIEARGVSTLFLKPDRVAMQDATAQMAILQFIVTGRDETALSATAHCDHLIRAETGAESDLERACVESKEVYDFLASAAKRYNMDFWGPGSGVIHQVLLEQYAFPGGLMIGADSHTPNAGGLGLLAVGVGGADAVGVMANQPWGLLNPKLIGVKLTGRLQGWASPKDVTLKLLGLLTVKGGTGKIVEYFGPGAESISCTGKATICNMGAELGATASLFPFDAGMERYLRATAREDIADMAKALAENLRADKEVEAEPEKYFDEVYEVNLSTLGPQWVGPHTPDLLHAAAEMKEFIEKEGYPDSVSSALIGSCTNSSYEDLSRAASIARQALAHGIKAKMPLFVSPGSDQVFRTIERDGLLKVFEAVGGTLLANACGPCIGQWIRRDHESKGLNTIVTTYNRNYQKRNDGNVDTLAFITSPEMAAAAAFAGRISFDPQKDTLLDASGKEFRFEAPSGDELPKDGFVFSRKGFEAPPAALEERKKVRVAISANSERLSFLEVFEPWDGKDFEDLLILLKAKGKCTTDHISQAGPWLKYRGHLAKISDNCLLGAVNAFTGEVGKGSNILSAEEHLPFPEIAKDYKSRGRSWVVIGEENYGEGSSREHAAMSPRYLGCKAVIVKSFARIHETNLKKQGVLPLTFKNPADYDAIEPGDLLSVRLASLSPGSEIALEFRKADGTKVEIKTLHTMTAEQIEWFRAGSALNTLKAQA